MTRYGEDLIWSNKITEAEAVLKFVVTLTEERADASQLRKGKVVRTFFLLRGYFGTSRLGLGIRKNEPRLPCKTRSYRINCKMYILTSSRLTQAADNISRGLCKTRALSKAYKLTTVHIRHEPLEKWYRGLFATYARRKHTLRKRKVFPRSRESLRNSAIAMTSNTRTRH